MRDWNSSLSVSQATDECSQREIQSNKVVISDWADLSSCPMLRVHSRYRDVMYSAARIPPTCPELSAEPPGRVTPCDPLTSPTGKRCLMFTDSHHRFPVNPPLLCWAQTAIS